MAFIPFPDGALAIIEVGNVNNKWTNTLWFENLFGTPADFQGLADFLFDWYLANVMTELHNVWSIQKVTTYDMSIQEGSVYISTQSPQAGSKVGEPAVISAAGVVTFYSALRGRTGRGRNYVTGFSEDDVSATAISNQLVIDALDLAYTILILQAQTIAEWVWVVASKQVNGAPRSQVNAAQIENISVRSATLGSQRRRIERA